MFCLDNILGNTQIINSLKSSIVNNRVSHAYIFSGQAGMGKKLLSSTFAKTLECEKHGAIPCGRCRSCITFESGNHPDIFYVKPTKTKGIGVNDIREQITENMHTKPFSNPYKIFIIDNADTMTVQAQNALLKSIEEPSQFGIFILLAQNYSIFLPTILSRCICYKLKAVPEHLIRDYLINKASVPLGNAELLSVYAGGNIGRSLRLANDEEFIVMRDCLIKIACQIKTCDLVQLFSLFTGFDTYKERIQEALDILYMWYRDILVLKSTCCYDFLVQPDMKIRLTAQASLYSVKELLSFLNAIEKAKRQIKQYANFQLVIEVMLMSLKGELE